VSFRIFFTSMRSSLLLNLANLLYDLHLIFSRARGKGQGGQGEGGWQWRGLRASARRVAVAGASLVAGAAGYSVGAYWESQYLPTFFGLLAELLVSFAL
jgi:hypothetical protein